MPSHYNNDKKKHSKSKPNGMKPMTKQEHDMFNKAVKDGMLTKKQHDNLPPHLLKAIIKSKTKNKKSKK